MINNNMNINPPEIIKKRGGKREGAGRKVGSVTKVQTKSIMAAIEKTIGVSWEMAFAQNYANAIESGDKNLIAKYDHMMYHKHVPEQIDHTSKGEKIISPMFVSAHNPGFPDE